MSDEDFDYRTDLETHPAAPESQNAQSATQLQPHQLAVLRALKRLGIAEVIERAWRERPFLIGIVTDGVSATDAVTSVCRGALFPGAKDGRDERVGSGPEAVVVTAHYREIPVVVSNAGISVIVLDDDDFAATGIGSFTRQAADVMIDLEVTAKDIHGALMDAYSDLAGAEFDIHEDVGINDLRLVCREGATGEGVVRALNKIGARRAAHVSESAKKKESEASPRGKAPQFEVTEPDGVRLSDLPGFGSAREWGLGFAQDLRYYAAGEVPWEEIGRGALLVGPPGSGKTTLMRALASEAGVPMIFTGYARLQGSDEGHMGHIMRGIKRLFEQARGIIGDSRVCLIAIDELDSIPPRGTASDRDGWFRPIVNALLAEIGSTPGLVVVGAANTRNLDEALLRPGRLDRVIEIPNPDRAEIPAILRHHLGADVGNLENAAVMLSGSSAADLEQVARTARRIARLARRPVTRADVYSAIDEAHPPLDPCWALRAAYHEAGHAIVAIDSGLYGDVEITLSGASQQTKLRPRDLDTAQSIGYLAHRVVVCLAGRLAEQRGTGSLSCGAGGGLTGRVNESESDLVHARSIALELETQHGIGVTGIVHVPTELTTAFMNQKIWDAVSKRLGDANTEADQILARRWHEVEALAQASVRERVLTFSRIREVIARAPRLPEPRYIEPEDEDALACMP